VQNFSILLFVMLGVANRHLSTTSVFVEEPPLDWSVQPKEFSTLVTPSTVPSSKALLFRHVNSYKKTFALTVIDNHVVVLHELKESTELDATGGQYLALAGDSRPVATSSVAEVANDQQVVEIDTLAMAMNESVASGYW